MSNPDNDYLELSNGEVRLWISPDRGALHIKCVTTHGDPVELAEEEVGELIAALRKLVAKIQ